MLFDINEAVVFEHPEKEFTFQGQEYVAYQREYGNGDLDVEVYPKGRQGYDVDGEVQEYAETLF